MRREEKQEKSDEAEEFCNFNGDEKESDGEKQVKGDDPEENSLHLVIADKDATEDKEDHDDEIPVNHGHINEDVIAARNKTEQSNSNAGDVWKKTNKQCKGTQTNMDEPRVASGFPSCLGAS